MKKIIMILFNSILCLIIVLFYILYTNKTFFKTTYLTNNNQIIFIPQYSYFKEECCMYSATFLSLRSKNDLQNEIDDYLSDFTYFKDETTYGYKKDDLFIQKYQVEDNGLYRKIIITYE